MVAKKIGKLLWETVKHKPIVYDIAEEFLRYKQKIEYKRIKPKLNALRKYYKKCSFPQLVENSQWRQYRFILHDGTGLKVKDQIRNTESLRRACIKYAPKAVYCTTSTWLNPVKVGKREEYKKPHYRIGDNIMLYHDLIFDIDNEDLEESRKIALELIEFMEKKGYSVKTIIFSGGKGFHVWFNEKNRPNIANPREREYYYMAQRKKILSEVIEAGIKIDPVVPSNTRCIVRVPGTVHWKTGYVASYVTKEQLQMPISELLKSIPRAWPMGAFKTEKGSGSKVWGQIIDNPIYWKLYKGYTSYFVTNKVPGLKDRYILILRYKYIWLNGVIRRLKALQKRFNLTDIYLFGSDINHRYVAVCLKTMQIRRLMKIVKNSYAANKEMFYTGHFKPSLLRLTEKISTENNEILAPKLKFIKTLKADIGINERNFVSLPHLKLLNKLFFKRRPKDYPNKHGKAELTYYKISVVEGRIYSKDRCNESDVFGS